MVAEGTLLVRVVKDVDRERTGSGAETKDRLGDLPSTAEIRNLNVQGRKNCIDVSVLENGGVIDEGDEHGPTLLLGLFEIPLVI